MWKALGGTIVATDSTSAADPIASLQARCKAAGLAAQARSFLPGQPAKTVEVQMPSAEGTRTISVDVSDIPDLLCTRFEQFQFIPGYDGIWSPHSHEVECVVRNPLGLQMTRLLFAGSRIPFKNVTTRSADDGARLWAIDVTSTNASTTLRFGSPSSELLMLCHQSAVSSGVSLRVTSETLITSDKALSILLSVANSFLYQIDQLIGLPFTLGRERFYRLTPGIKLKHVSDPIFPSRKYDQPALELYWNARTSSITTLQYLAYYQVLEFYFDVYWDREAKQRIRGVLTDLTFRAESDRDLARLMDIIRNKRNRPNERSQLEATIRACVAAEDLDRFLASMPEKQREQLRKKSMITRRHVLSDKNVDALINQVACRVFNVRCRIVHTKSQDDDDEEEAPILPFSKEAGELGPDVDLMKWLAERVLSDRSMPFD